MVELFETDKTLFVAFREKSSSKKRFSSELKCKVTAIFSARTSVLHVKNSMLETYLWRLVPGWKKRTSKSLLAGKLLLIVLLAGEKVISGNLVGR